MQAPFALRQSEEVIGGRLSDSLLGSPAAHRARYTVCALHMLVLTSEAEEGSSPAGRPQKRPCFRTPLGLPPSLAVRGRSCTTR